MNKAMNIYTIFDTKAEIYNQPFYANNNNHAIRMVGDALGDPNHDFAKHPEDFLLFHIGEFDQDNGTLTADDVTFVVKIEDLKK